MLTEYSVKKRKGGREREKEHSNSLWIKGLASHRQHWGGMCEARQLLSWRFLLQDLLGVVLRQLLAAGIESTVRLPPCPALFYTLDGTMNMADPCSEELCLER